MCQARSLLCEARMGRWKNAALLHHGKNGLEVSWKQVAREMLNRIVLYSLVCAAGSF